MRFWKLRGCNTCKSLRSKLVSKNGAVHTQCVAILYRLFG
jgi:hypothetical protein